MRLVLAFVVGVALVAPAWAIEKCPVPEKLLGPTVPFDQLVQPALGADLKKGEFETTEQFEARKAAMTFPSEALLQIHMDPSQVTYDADHQEFKVYESQFRPNFQFSYLTGVPESERARFGDISNDSPVAILLNDEESDGGTYEAQNTYGATTTVTRQMHKVTVVFQDKGRDGPNWPDDLFGVHFQRKPGDMPFAVPLSEAKDVKPRLKFVAYVKPYSPYAVKAHFALEPTRDVPVERSNDVTVLLADIVCLGVTDGQRVVDSWATR